mmetsp:Transcript_66107/g.131117  ORF Transcript_66107/g.131117 Transcript_66107/m.131117 type:complete len:121 (-) Transcript_66107:102-464(-)
MLRTCTCARTAEVPGELSSTAAIATDLADVVLDLGPGARSRTRRSMMTDAYDQNHHPRAWRTRQAGAGSRSPDLPKLPLMVPMMESSSPSIHTASQLVQHALKEVAVDDSAAAYSLDPPL